MRHSHSESAGIRLQPPGRRWGFGAHTVLPYLAHALSARAGEDSHPDASIRNPVFPQMDDALRALRGQH